MRTVSRAVVGVSIGLVQFAYAAPLTPGNLLVTVVGEDGRPIILSTTATPVMLREFTTSGLIVQTFTLPSFGSQALTMSGTNLWEGTLTENAGWFSVIGYRASAGTTQIARTTPAATPRAIAILSTAGVLDLTNAWTDAYGSDGITNSVPRCALTDGTRIWAAGSGFLSGGTRTALRGFATSSTVINSQMTRVLGQDSGQCIATDGAGIGTFSAPWPTSAASTTYLPGFPDGNPAAISAQEFAFADSNTLYVADDRNTNGGTGGDPADNGIRKYIRTGSTWAFQYRLQAGLPVNGSGLSSGVRAFTLAKSVTGPNTLYAVGAATSANSIYKLVDTGPSAQFVPIFQASPNQVFRGIRIVPGATTNKTLSGTVDFGAGYAGSAPVPVKFDIKSTSGTVLQTTTLYLTPSGETATYSLPLTSAVVGSVTVSVDAPTHLLRKSGTLSAASNIIFSPVLTNGDCDGDDVVSVFDYILLSDGFDFSFGQSGYDPNADLDKDGVVSVFDYIILSDHFDETGDQN